MYYSSRIGCVIYLDDVIGGLHLCEPTLLFLLGLDAVTTPSSEYILHIPVIDSKTGKQAIDEETGEPKFEDEPNKYLLKNLVIHKDIVGEEIFNKIIDALKFSYSIIQLTDSQVDFDLKGLKLFMNNITGTSEDRIVPFIFHEHKNEFVLGPIDEDNKYNCLADKMQKVFSYAGYDVGDNEVRLVGKSFITDEATIDSINEYNKDVLAEHEDKKFYRHIYKILDYKSMYSYALGVLFGCKCLGFSDNDIFRSDPANWYDGEFVNLISLASRVFKFHYTHSIPEIDVDPCLYRKYRDIQVNKIWNFDNDVVQLKQDEKNCTVLYIDDNEVVESHIVYSKSTGPQKPIPGSYLLDDSTWQQLDDLVISSSDPKKGIIHNCDKPVIRYIAHTRVELRRAYQYANHKYLSPNKDEIYFTDFCKIGWLNFDFSSFKDQSYLQIDESDFDDLPIDNFNNAVRKSDGKVLGYYKVLVNSDIELYCVLDGKITRLVDKWSFDGVSDTFDQVLTQDLFDSEFYHTQDIFSPTEDVVKLWDTDNPMWLYLSPRKTNCTIPVINGNSRKASNLIYNYRPTSADDQTYMEALEPGIQGNNLSVDILWQDSWSGRVGYKVTVYNNDTAVYSSPYRIQSFNEAQNNYVSFVGKFPSAPNWYGGMSFRWYLSSGIDEDAIGIPLYYEDGTQVKSNPFISYKITEILQKKYVKHRDNVYTDNLNISINDIKFVTDDSGNLLLQYSGESDIVGIYGFSFMCDNVIDDL